MAVRRKFLTSHFLAVFMAASALMIAAPAYANGGGGGSKTLPSQAAQEQIDPEAAYREGLAALDAKNFKLAEEKMGDVLSVARDHPEANYFMGLAKIGRGKIKASLRYFERAVKNRPDYVDAREKLAMVFVETGKPEKASEHVLALQEILAGCADSACSEEKIQRIENAIASIEAAMESGQTNLASASPDADQHAALFLKPREEGATKYLMAVRLINQERYREAIESLYASQKTVGPHPDILNYLGFAHRKINEFDRAQTYYAQALSLDPGHLGAHEYLGELYLELGDMKRARKQLATLESLCVFGCAEREDLARLIDVKETIRRAGAADVKDRLQ